MDLFNYFRRKSSTVNIGATPVGGSNPIRIQSMTNISTLNTNDCVEQIKKIADVGGDYVRLTTQGIREAENLKNINSLLRSAGYMIPLIADVHFNPHVANVAALYAEKVRVNPGNFVGATRAFKKCEYTNDEYLQETQKMREEFISFLDICKENHTSIRIGVNHGSLSNRIMSRYGDTPLGMVESCMEFLRICIEQNFNDVVISIKSSNTIVMVKTVRLLIKTMEQENMLFPLHLGVTEAGEGEDGRIKSALGIGALLSDGIGDTIRVSLSEAPEAEIPVACKLVEYIGLRENQPHISAITSDTFDYFNPSRRITRQVHNIGGNKIPIVISSQFEHGKIEISSSYVPDYIYTGHNLPDNINIENKIGYIVDADVWHEKANLYPVYNYKTLPFIGNCSSDLKFLFMSYSVFNEEVIACLKTHPEIVVISQSNHPNRLGEHRALAHKLMDEKLRNPLVFFQHYKESIIEDFQIKAAVDMGALIVDGLCDGLCLYNMGGILTKTIDATAFNILQAGRLRMSKTEYISCPGCGRTLYDMQKTIAQIKQATKGLKGLKIGIMGCIVNGPGEMADADYGYVGSGPHRVNLYKRKICVEKNIPEEQAVDKLLNLIQKDKKLK